MHTLKQASHMIISCSLMIISLFFSNSGSDHEDDDENLHLITEGELVYGASDEEEETAKSDSDDDSESNNRPGQLYKPQMASSSQSVVEEGKCIAFSSSLELLAQTTVPSICPKKNCSQIVTSTNTQKGTALWITWVSQYEILIFFTQNIIIIRNFQGQTINYHNWQ